MIGRRVRVATLVAATLTGLAIVGGLSAPSAAAAPAQTAPPDAAAACTSSPPQKPGTSKLQTISSGGRDRTYQLHLPTDYASKSDWPLIIAYHGRGETGASLEKFSQLSTLPAVVAYPNGVVGTGSGNRQAWQGAPYAAAGVDDIAFTGDLLDSLEKSLCVDKTRVYATGKSNGAGFTGLLGCQTADRFAAIAPVAGAFYNQTANKCHPSRPVPVIEFHGTADSIIPNKGNAGRHLPAIKDWVQDWADRDGCNAKPTDSSAGSDVTESRWTGCKGGAEIRHDAITGGGHTWPGADSPSGPGAVAHTIKAQDVIWQFVSKFRLPAG